MRSTLVSRLALSLGVAVSLWLPVGVQAFAGQQRTETPEPTIVVRDPGEQPRAPLRWIIPPAGTARTMTVSLASTMGGSMLGTTLSMDMVMTTESTVVGPGPDNSTTVLNRVVDVRAVDDATATDALRASGLVGWSWESDVAADGRVVQTRTEFPAGSDPTVRATVDQLVPQLQGMTKPFPTEPIGLGARWRVTEELETNGIPVTNRTDYRLVRRSGNQVELSMKVRQTAKRGPADFPGLPAGVTVDVTSWRGTGVGRQILDLSQPFDPVTSESKMRARQEFQVRQGNQSENATLNTLVEFAVEE